MRSAVSSPCMVSCLQALQSCIATQIEYILDVLKNSSDEKFDNFCIGLLITQQEEIVKRFLLNDGKICVNQYFKDVLLYFMHLI